MLRAANGLRSTSARSFLFAPLTGALQSVQDCAGSTPAPQRRFFDASDRDGKPTTLRAPFPILGFLRFVPEKQACVVERFGRFNRVLNPGLNFTIPLIEWISYTHTLKELALNVNTQQAITRDNVTIHISGVLYIRIVDPFRASYGVDQPLFAVMQLAQTSMRSELGKMTLDNTFEERDSLNEKIVRVINGAAKTWGLECLRYEIKDIVPPPAIVKAMELQAEAERRKRAQVLESEGVRQATINESEAQREAAINRAIGEAESIQKRAEATAIGVKNISGAITGSGGREAVSMHIAQQYVDAFGKIAKEGNTMIVPADASNVASMIATATGVLKANGGVTVGGGSTAGARREGSGQSKPSAAGTAQVESGAGKERKDANSDSVQGHKMKLPGVLEDDTLEHMLLSPANNKIGFSLMQFDGTKQISCMRHASAQQAQIAQEHLVLPPNTAFVGRLTEFKTYVNSVVLPIYLYVSTLGFEKWLLFKPVPSIRQYHAARSTERERLHHTSVPI